TTTVAVKQKAIKGDKVSGKVLDANTNTPLAGVSVSVPGFSATISNEKGEFSVTVPDYKSTLQIAYLGYHTKLHPVRKGKTITAKLYPETFPSVFASVNLPSGAKS